MTIANAPFSDASFVVIDTETTGLDYEGGDRAIEIAARELGNEFREFETLVNPERSIPFAASAIHHLLDRDVLEAPLYPQALARLQFFLEVIEDVRGVRPVLVAHNADFDYSFLPGLGVYRWLCSKRLAQHVFPGAPAFNNQVLRYYLGGTDLDLRGYAPHRAMADVIVTEFNLGKMLAAYLDAGHPEDVDALIALAESPIRIRTMPFGKHRGAPLASLPMDYLHWALRSGIDDRDLIWSLRLEVERRGQVPA